jgi:2'-5' RNA ligase
LIRTFIAINLDSGVVGRIAALQATLKEAGADVRWVRPEGFHLTLKFLGDVQRSQPPLILSALREALAGQPPLRVRARGLGMFPTAKRPRVLWVKLEGPGLAEMRDKVEEALIPLAFPRDERDFAPHLTLGRVRSLRGWDRLLPCAREAAEQDFGESRVDEVVLYRSDLDSTGAVYTPLGRVSLAGAGAVGD